MSDMLFCEGTTNLAVELIAVFTSSLPYLINKTKCVHKPFIRCLFYFIIITLLNDNSYMSLLAVNIAEFVDQNEMCEKLILVGL